MLQQILPTFEKTSSRLYSYTVSLDSITQAPQILTTEHIKQALSLIDSFLSYFQQITDIDSDALNMLMGILNRVIALKDFGDQARIDQDVLQQEIFPEADKISKTILQFTVTGTYDNDLPSFFKDDKISSRTQRLSINDVAGQAISLDENASALTTTVKFPNTLNLKSLINNTGKTSFTDSECRFPTSLI